VVLHTGDGGATWQVQRDGRRANALMIGALVLIPALSHFLLRRVEA